MFPDRFDTEGRIDKTAWEPDAPIPEPAPTPPGYFDTGRRGLFDHEFGAAIESVPPAGVVS